MPAPFELEFFQRGVVEILLLAIACGLVGTWVVLRGLVVLRPRGRHRDVPRPRARRRARLLRGARRVRQRARRRRCSSRWLARRRGDARDSVTAIVLAGSLAIGVILASDVFGSQARVDRLLFGSLLAIDGSDQAARGAGRRAGGARRQPGCSARAGWRPASAAASSGAARAGRTPRSCCSSRSCAVAALSAVGALLATALIVVAGGDDAPADRAARAWQVATVALAAVEGVGGLWLSLRAERAAGRRDRGARADACSRCVRARHGSCGRGAVPRGRCWRASPLRRSRPSRCWRLLALAGCGSSDAADDGRVNVVATTTQLADIAREVAGPAADVHALLAAGSRPAHLRAAPGRLEALARRGRRAARAGWASTTGRASSSMRPAAMPRSSTSARGIPVRRRAADGDRDPHWWHDPRNVVAASRTVRARAARAPARRRIARVGGARLPRAARRRSTRASPRCLERDRRPPSAGSSPTTTRSATSPRATACVSSAPSSRRSRRRRRHPPASRRARADDPRRARARGLPEEPG